MTQSLFLTSQLDFPKLAAEATLPEDPNSWASEVLQEAYKQVSYLADFDLHVVMREVDGERGYGLGHIQVTSKSEAPMDSPEDQMHAAGIRSARIPVVIKDGKLSPLDILITDSDRSVPLTEARLRQSMFRPQNFDVTSKTPGDQSMIGQLYPPFRQNYGFGGGGMAVGAGKTASAESTLLEVALSAANSSDMTSFRQAVLGDTSVKLAYAENVATHPALQAVTEANVVPLEKSASAFQARLRPSVVQVAKADHGYSVKTASHHAWEPKGEQLDRGEVIRRFGFKVALAADLSGSATLAADEGVVEGQVHPAAAGPISAPGMYQVQSTDGSLLTGAVITNLLDVDGRALPISLFTDGVHASIQSDMAGTPVGAFTPPGTVDSSQAQGYGAFFSMQGGLPQATIPLKLGATIQNGVDEQPKYQAETFDGRQVMVAVQPYVQAVVGVDGTMLIPQGWSWMPLSEAEAVAVAEHPDEVGKLASVKGQLCTVELRAGGPDCFSLQGFPVEKIAMDQRQFLTQDEALFLLVGLGTNPEYAQSKLAEALGGSRQVTKVRVGHALKLAEERRGESKIQAADYLSNIPCYRRQLWKEAAVIPDPLAVDAVLSLGFLNPENLSAFVGHIPVLDEAQHRLCDLLLASRIGLREVPEGAVARAVRAMEDVIDGLKVIAFQN